MAETRANQEAEANPNMSSIGRALRYNQYLVDYVRPYLGDRVLDVGCGVGNTTRLLQRPYVVGMDTAEVYLREFRAALPQCGAILDDISRPADLRGLHAHRFDTVFSSNVLEHIPDDASALANMHSLLVPGGHIALIVPNYPWLYGAQDAYVEHVRRYSKASLRAALVSAGFTVQRLFCINLPGVPWWFLNGRILRKAAMEEWEPGLIDHVIPLVRLIDRLTLNLAGLSLVAIARK